MSYYSEAIHVNVWEIPFNETREYYYNVPNHPDSLSLSITVIKLQEDKKWHFHSSFFSFLTSYYRQYTEMSPNELEESDKQAYNNFMDRLLTYLNS